METIYKYEIKGGLHQRIQMPIGADILCVQTQNEIPQIWAKCDLDNKAEIRTFHVFGTGHKITNQIKGNLIYIGTFQIESFQLVFHLFEESNVS